MSLESPNLSLLSDSALVPGPLRLWDAGLLPHQRPWRRLLLRDTLDPSPRGLGGGGLPLSLAGGALLCALTNSSFSFFRLGEGIRSAPAGSNARLGGALRATPAGFPLGVDPGGRRGLTLTSVASSLLCSG